MPPLALELASRDVAAAVFMIAIAAILIIYVVKILTKHQQAMTGLLRDSNNGDLSQEVANLKLQVAALAQQLGDLSSGSQQVDASGAPQLQSRLIER